MAISSVLAVCFIAMPEEGYGQAWNVSQSPVYLLNEGAQIGIGTQIPQKTLHIREVQFLSTFNPPVDPPIDFDPPVTPCSNGIPSIRLSPLPSNLISIPGNNCPELVSNRNNWDLEGASEKFAIRFNDQERISLRSNGNLGIGYTTPNFPLSFGTSVVNTKIALYEDNGTNVFGMGYNTSQFRLHVGSIAGRFSFLNSPNSNVELMTIRGTGNVGIGNNNPPSRLFVRSNNDVGTNNFAQFVSANGTQGIGIGFNSINAIGSIANQDIVINPKGTGRVAIGIVPSPTVPQIKLQVNAGNIQSITGNFTTTGPPIVGDRWNTLGDRIPFATTPGFASTGLRSQWGQYSANFGIIERSSGPVRDGIVSWQDGTTTDAPSTLNSTNSRLRFVFRNNKLPSEADNALEAMTIFANGKVGINVGNLSSTVITNAIDNPSSADIKLLVAGNILCEEVKVELRGNWPDFVFAKEYPLLTLEEKATFIEKNSHLPNVPSAQEVATNGVELGKMDATLLRQIEELTLHMIELKKQNDLLQKQVDVLAEKVSNK